MVIASHADLAAVIATSGPSSTYPQRAYRNPTDALVKYLDYKHGANWAIWEFRAEGTGYPDGEVYNRIRHYPWPDHHPPPFALIPNIMASMRDWLKDPKDPEDGRGRVVVVHCKAGKGRSGTAACSYLISEEGWSMEDALARFTARRMRSGFGSGVSIPSQLRWVGYVDWWAKHGKIYVERQVEILEVHVWGLRNGVKVAVEGYVEEGRTIKTFHVFGKHERMLMDGPSQDTANSAIVSDHANEKTLPLHESDPQPDSSTILNKSSSSSLQLPPESDTSFILFRPTQRLILPTSDINIDLERRNRAAYGFTMVTSVAHVWFNPFFESQMSSTAPRNSAPSPTSATKVPSSISIPDSGVFKITWEAMDGIKGSARKGTRAFDHLAVVWRAIDESKKGLPKIITEPQKGVPIPETGPADWKRADKETPSPPGRDLGLRAETPNSANVSKANSVVDLDNMSSSSEQRESSEAGVKPHRPQGEEHVLHPDYPTISVTGPASPGCNGANGAKGAPKVDLGMQKVHSPANSPGISRDVAFDKVAGGEDGLKAVEEEDLPTPEEHIPGQLLRDEEATPHS